MKAIDKWNELTEDEKLYKCLHYTIMAMQGFLLNHEKDENLSEYCELLRGQIDWVSIKCGDGPLPLYYGPGRNNAKDFHLHIDDEELKEFVKKEKT